MTQAAQSSKNYQILLNTPDEKDFAKHMMVQRSSLKKQIAKTFDVVFQGQPSDHISFQADSDKQAEQVTTIFKQLSVKHAMGERIEKSTILELAIDMGLTDENGVTAEFKQKAANQNRKDVGFKPRNHEQTALLEALHKNLVTVAEGPAGTGKTRAACAVALEKLKNNEIDRIVLCRPALAHGEAGNAALPGDEHAKLLPYLRPLYAELSELLGGGDRYQQLKDGANKLQKLINNKQVEIVPLETIRGRTIKHAYMIVDEAQNATSEQMKMVLTRPGVGTQVAITGANDQCDLPAHPETGKKDNGLADFMERIKKPAPNIQVVKLTICERSELAKTVNDIYAGAYDDTTPEAAQKVEKTAKPVHKTKKNTL